ncbi:hypothetical protein AB0K89_02130 [Streptomyces cinnamoneus]|uniref:hypothetical protein n=1 Tax=Streptomyces cinnamoneus TaxID=53446 RepID=UPI00341E616F
MPPDRMQPQARSGPAEHRLDRNIPRSGRGETFQVHDVTELRVDLRAGAFVALVVVMVLLIFSPSARPVLWALLVPVLATVARSYLRYRRLTGL